MTQKESRAKRPNCSKLMDGERPAKEFEIGRPSPERSRAANEVGSAIAHQLNGPLTALRLYIGEIRKSSGRFPEGAEAQDNQTDDNIEQIVENAFQEMERICAMMRLITDSFDGPLYPENATALGRDVISWWSRHGLQRDGSSPPIQTILTPREREVLGHISQGCSNKQGAICMAIAPRTFESHRAELMRKFGARNGVDLVRMALGENPVRS
jgi:DNA-binding CsgD family transcriptional regulator